MIPRRAKRTPDAAAAEFTEWALLFPEGLFVHIAVYADESGTHDETGVQKGAREATVSGLVACVEDWKPFCKEWQKLLKEYDAPYFHFSEWSEASAIARNKRPPSSGFKNNPYREWDSNRLNEFVIKLATIVGSGNKLIVGGLVRTKEFHQAKIKGDVPLGANPYELCIKEFFDEFENVLEHVRAPWKRQPVSFFFDWSDDEEWRNAVFNMFCPFKERHPRFSVPSFQHKTDSLYLPLQAADMVAFRSRQIIEKWVDQDCSVQWPELDHALFKTSFDYFEQRRDIVLNAHLAGLLKP